MTTIRLDPTDKQAAIDAVISAKHGDTLIYGSGMNPGPLGPLFWRLGNWSDGAGMFALVRKPTGKAGTERHFEYRAQRTRQKYSHEAVQRAAKSANHEGDQP